MMQVGSGGEDSTMGDDFANHPYNGDWSSIVKKVKASPGIDLPFYFTNQLYDPKL